MTDTPNDPPTRVTLSGDPPMDGEHCPAPNMARHSDGQYKDHWVLSEHERRKGFVRPVREAYWHLKCGTVTAMPRAIAETYARDPRCYASTFCATCKKYRPVGAGGEFVWFDRETWKPTTEKVGT